MNNLAVAAETLQFQESSFQQFPGLPEHKEINRELRIATDTATWLAETLHGSMQTSFEFTYDGKELRGEDGGSMDEIFDDAVEEAQAMVTWNPSLLFELRRRLIEREELDDMHKMVNGELPNTMIVLSDFPPELMDAKEDVGGYNVKRQPTMMRIITLQKDGKLRVVSQSLDGSNREALEAIGVTIGDPFEEGELLSQRRHLDLPEEQQDNLADSLTRVYDDSLTEQLGGEWHAGISQQPDRNMVNTYEFVMAQQDLIAWFTKEKLANPTGAEKFRYQLAATAKARYERYLRSLKNQNANQTVTGLVSYNSFVSEQSVMYGQVLTRELNREGRSAASRGEVFSGCGGTVTANESSTEDQLSDSGYGNKSKSKSSDGEDGECEFISKECPECHEKNVKTTVTKTHITGSCGCSVRRKPKNTRA
jgi:hypothetical protein